MNPDKITRIGNIFAGLTLGFLAVFAGQVLAQEAMSAMDKGGMSHGMSATGGEGVEHDHPALPVDPSLPIPSLTHLAFPDAMDGYNIQILVRNFTFTPASINREVVPNEGHAHIYINGAKISRVYGNWYHIPSSLFAPGVNALTVTLNANDHSTWATPDGALIASTVAIIRPASDE
ncbi:hypothetical protein [uncultured Sulfitobacter sp.]|uniref:hypothetical protein n=1 Tax=uncultured Sulfitobacter sp. TaxID=191468 RepID=UPI00261F6B7E|nr:hypothetical protein [uncultured Sulfitobacter sp.]